MSFYFLFKKLGLIKPPPRIKTVNDLEWEEYIKQITKDLEAALKSVEDKK